MDKIYLAARYSRNDEMRMYRDWFTRNGFTVTSRWIDCHPDITGTPQLTASFTPGFLTASPELCYQFAEYDLEDLDAADTIVNFTTVDGGGKGGRHVEFGYALGKNKNVVIVGPRENVFHTIPEIRQYDDWQSFVVDIRRNRDGLRG